MSRDAFNPSNSENTSDLSDTISDAKDRASGRINSEHPVIQKIGDVNFLGPFDGQLRLVRMDWEHAGIFSDQIGQLVKRLERVITK